MEACHHTGVSSVEPYDPKLRRTPHAFLLVYIALAAGIVATGYLYFRAYQNHYRGEVINLISSIAALKRDELVKWRRECFSDAGIMYRNPVFSSLARRCLGDPPDAEACRAIQAWFHNIHANQQYNRVCLHDAAGVERVSSPAEPVEHSADFIRHARETMRSGMVSFQDFHRNEHDGRIYLSLCIPVSDAEAGGRTLGFIGIRIDPEEYLYPLIRRWPVPTRSAETLIVRREGDSVLYLNELRHRKDPALTLRFPVSTTRAWLPPAMAVTGATGIVEGRDYRDVPVIADVGPVPDSPWFLIARMDRAEVYAPVRRQAWITSAAVLTLLIGAGALTVLLWRHQDTRFFREKYEASEALRDSESKYRTLYEGSVDGIFLMTDLFTDCNEQACRLWRCRREEIVGHSPAEFSPPVQPDGQPSMVSAKNRIDRALAGEPQFFYWKHRAKDGTLMDTEVSLKALTVSGKPLLQATVRDISTRKEAERKLSEATRALTARSRCSRALVCATEEAALLREVCRIVVEDCGYRMAWVGFAEEGPGKAVRPVAWAGAEDNYLATFRISWGDNERGRGPTGTAIRTGAPSIARNTASDPLFAPLAEAARKRGFASTISLPLFDGGDAFGAICIYAAELNAFRGEEVQLLTELSSDLAYGITALRTRAERQRAQKELEEYRDRLEEMVKERTAQLAESNRRLETVNRELEAFSYSASHDLRAPLRSMEGFSQALLEDYGGAMDGKAKDYLGRIIASSRTMAELIDDLLSLSRVSRAEIRLAKADLSAMAEAILAAHAEAEPGRSVECVVAPGATARCDPRLLRIALENLLGNAWKFTAKQPKARIEFGAVREDGRTVFRVRDNGAGFEMEYVGKLFNPFQRLHAAGDFPGTGIGLAIVQRIVSRHGGTVRAEGKPGEGATFSFTL